MGLTVLYEERKVEWDFHSDEYPNAVFVWLRKWSSKKGGRDFVMETKVIVDREVVIHDFKAYDGYDHQEAELQRMAIAKFDELLAAHPSLSKAEA